MRLVVMAALGVGLEPGCGGAGRPPIGCEHFLASLDCGDLDFDFRTVISEDFCSQFDELACPQPDYFICLAEESECDEETGIFTLAQTCQLTECDED